jgi:hypothetical protein
MIYFIGIHHKENLPAFCSSTRSGKKIDAVIEKMTDPICRKINLFTTSHLPKRGTSEFAKEINKFIDYVPENAVLVLLGNEVQKLFPYHLYNKSKIVKFRHPSFSKSSFVDDLASLLVT